MVSCPTGKVWLCKSLYIGSNPILTSKIRVCSSIGRALVSKTRGCRFDPYSTCRMPLRITVSTYGFGPYGGSSILSGVTKMVIWSSGLGAGLQTQIGGFDSYYHLNGFGGNPRIDDESMSTTTTERSRTIDGSYPTIEWSITISRYKLPRWRNGSVFVLHTNGGGSIPPRGTRMGSHDTVGS